MTGRTYALGDVALQLAAHGGLKGPVPSEGPKLNCGCRACTCFCASPRKIQYRDQWQLKPPRRPDTSNAPLQDPG